MSDDATVPITPPWERSARFWEQASASYARAALLAEQEGQLQLQLVELQPPASSTATRAVWDLRRRLGAALLQQAADAREVSEAYRKRAATMRATRSSEVEP